MSSNRDDRDDFFANNNGIVTSWNEMILAIVGILVFLGICFAIALLSKTPSYMWLATACDKIRNRGNQYGN